jgi:hypothetical protein
MGGLVGKTEDAEVLDIWYSWCDDGVGGFGEVGCGGG